MKKAEMQHHNPNIPESCRACGRPLLLANLYVDDGCPCNSPRGVNFTPKPCAVCELAFCVKPGHRIKELFGISEGEVLCRITFTKAMTVINTDTLEIDWTNRKVYLNGRDFTKEVGAIWEGLSLICTRCYGDGTVMVGGHSQELTDARSVTCPRCNGSRKEPNGWSLPCGGCGKCLDCLRMERNHA